MLASVLAILAFFLLLFLFIPLFLWRIYQGLSPASPRSQPVRATFAAIPNYGAQSTTPHITQWSKEQCLQLPQAAWITTDTAAYCQCLPTYYGSYCSLQEHDARYRALGTPSLEQKTLGTYLPGINKSFPVANEETCSSACDAQATCPGFLYEDGNCTLLRAAPLLAKSEDLPFLPHNNTLYMRNDQGIVFSEEYTLARTRKLPAHHWLRSQESGILRGTLATVEKLDFFPRSAQTVPGSLGVYSLHPFPPAIARALLTVESEHVYIHRDGEPLQLPRHWRHHLPLYVCYLPSPAV